MPRAHEYSPEPLNALVVPELLSVAVTARLMSVSARTVRRMIVDGRLDRVRIGRRVLVTRRSLDRLLGRTS